MKKTIKMNERELNRLISESVKRALNEDMNIRLKNDADYGCNLSLFDKLCHAAEEYVELAKQLSKKAYNMENRNGREFIETLEASNAHLFYAVRAYSHAIDVATAYVERIQDKGNPGEYFNRVEKYYEPAFAY